ncbi:MAG: uracil-DNA glycosylase family protein [Candidatus Hydrogenedentes bacterium]|jgi:uracil-DNA glycosylase|nr:uracil-DNA glycosylase family protein [Candidatus Hydrogenedentota bacterium]
MPSKKNNDVITAAALEKYLKEVRACCHCADVLPLGCRPILRVKITARILIAGQAPGIKVHESGIPWNDPSGDRLRSWLGLDRKQFYDDTQIAIISMGFCYPGRSPRGGDLPPRPECAELWLEKLLSFLPNLETTILAGAYAQKWYLGKEAKRTLTETVENWKDWAPRYFPVPHPSFRNNHWLKKNPWFEKDLVPVLQKRMKKLLH